MTASGLPTQDDVLDDFTLEGRAERVVLDRYLLAYPQYAAALLDVFHEMQAAESVGRSEDADEAWIEQSWRAFEVGAGTAAAPDPFAGMSGQRMAEVRQKLGVRSATLMGFRDRVVEVASVPHAFLRALAEAIETTFEVLVGCLALPARGASAQSYRSDRAPRSAGEKLTFEELLTAANEPPEVRARLLEEED